MLELEALHALEEADSRTLQKHMRDCDECRAELDSLRETAAYLSYTIETLSPSASLRDRVLDIPRTYAVHHSSLNSSREKTGNSGLSNGEGKGINNATG